MSILTTVKKDRLIVSSKDAFLVGKEFWGVIDGCFAIFAESGLKPSYAIVPNKSKWPDFINGVEVIEDRGMKGIFALRADDADQDWGK